jgi:hypothetical protein
MDDSSTRYALLHFDYTRRAMKALYCAMDDGWMADEGFDDVEKREKITESFCACTVMAILEIQISAILLLFIIARASFGATQMRYQFH